MLANSASTHPSRPGSPAALLGIPVIDHWAADRHNLRDRELEVLGGMSAGQSNPAIGRRLFISEDTVKSHARSLFKKLGAKDRAHAVSIAWQLGILRAPQERR